MTSTVQEMTTGRASTAVQGARCDDDLATLMTSLLDELDGVVPDGWLIRCVARNVQWLREVGVSDEYLAGAARSLVAAELADVLDCAPW